jgi:hypothetical protein
MTGMQRAFAHHQQQPSPLLQCHVGRPRQQGRRHASGDFGHRTDRTRSDNHASGPERSARNRSGHVVDTMVGVGQRLHIRDLERSPAGECNLRGLRQHQMRFNAGIAQELQQPDAIQNPRCAGNSDDQATRN